MSASKRVAIAKDVLKHLNDASIKIEHGTYCSFKTYPFSFDGEELQAKLPEIEDCKVCALGAAMLSHVRLYDNFKMCGNKNNLTDDQITTTLQKHFSKKQLGLIEACFEKRPDLYIKNVGGVNGWYGLAVDKYNKECKDKTIMAAVKFGRKCHGDKARLKAIMMNIVKNNGLFCP